MKLCSRCVLPSSFPGISFNENNVCNYCLHSKLPDAKKRNEYHLKFEELLNSVKGKHDYDVIIAYSGGKDSTYTLYKLSHEYNLKILAYTLDNGFISETAYKNISKMTDSLNVTSIILKPPFDVMKKAFRLSATKDLYSPKTLDRASSICTTCIGIVKSMVLKTAIQMKIPLVAFGWTPGQAPISSAIMKTNPRLQSITHKTVRDPILKHLNDDMRNYFLSDEDLTIDKSLWPTNIHPLAFIQYNEKKITEKIKSLGWENPVDTDPNSTNCILNSLANYLHREKFKYHPYAWEMAGIVRIGGMTREKAVENTTKEEDLMMVQYAAHKLDINI